MAIEDKLYQVRFNVDKEAHIVIDKQICSTCPDKPCLVICPVENYKLEDGSISFSWQGCLECGTCRIACYRGAVSWRYPRGGYGVSFRFG